MKILQINTVYGIASTGRSMAELHEFLQSKGHQSYIAAVNIKHLDYSFRIGNKFEMFVHSLFSRLMGKQGYYSNRTTNELLKFVQSKKPDVVHLRVLHSNCLNIYKLLKFLGEHNYPVVISLHDCWFFTGHCCYFTEAGCYKWKKACGHCPEIHKWNKSWFFDRSSQNLALKKQLFDGIKRLAVVGVSLGVGINALTILTSGILGFPGLLALYGIGIYNGLKTMNRDGLSRDYIHILYALIDNYYNVWNLLDPFLREAMFHINFMRIHPFEDGNKRCAKIILASNLLKSFCAPIIITEEDTKEYYEFINNCDYEVFLKY